jgi:hypothetical protein
VGEAVGEWNMDSNVPGWRAAEGLLLRGRSGMLLASICAVAASLRRCWRMVLWCASLARQLLQYSSRVA